MGSSTYAVGDFPTQKWGFLPADTPRPRVENGCMAAKARCGHCGLISSTVLKTRVWGFGLALCSQCFEKFMRVMSDFTPHRDSSLPRGTFLAVKR
jgi:hypothetical protein